MLLYAKDIKVNKYSPYLLDALDNLYDVVREYKPKNIYNMDKIGLFFRLIPKYFVLLSTKDKSITCDEKKFKEGLTLIVSTFTFGYHKLLCLMIGKATTLACLVEHILLLYFNHKNLRWIKPYLICDFMFFLHLELEK